MKKKVIWKYEHESFITWNRLETTRLDKKATPDYSSEKYLSRKYGPERKTRLEY